MWPKADKSSIFELFLFLIQRFPYATLVNDIHGKYHSFCYLMTEVSGQAMYLDEQTFTFTGVQQQFPTDDMICFSQIFKNRPRSHTRSRGARQPQITSRATFPATT